MKPATRAKGEAPLAEKAAKLPVLAKPRPPKPRRRAEPVRLAVVIPAYNEEGAVAATVADVDSVMKKSGISYEIVVVDDGSSDNTRAEAEKTVARVVHYDDNVGYGYALKTGIASTSSELVAILDADGTYPAHYLPLFVEMTERCAMVVGDRGEAMANVPLIRRPAKWVLNNLASSLARHKITDLNSGLRVFRRAELEQFVPLLPNQFSFTTTITLCMLASNLKVGYHPIKYGKRVGHSKIRASHFFRFLSLVIRLTVYFQPLRVFIPVGTALFLAGFAKAVWDNMQSPFSLSDGATFGFLGAIMIWSFGLLADMVAKLHLKPPPQDWKTRHR